MAAAPSTTDLITVRIVNDVVGDFSLILPQHAQNHLHNALDAGLFQNAEQMQIFLDGIVTEALVAVSDATCYIGAAAKQLAEDADSRAATEQMAAESFALWAQETFGEMGVVITVHDLRDVPEDVAVQTFLTRMGIDPANDLSDVDPLEAEDRMAGDAGR